VRWTLGITFCKMIYWLCILQTGRRRITAIRAITGWPATCLTASIRIGTWPTAYYRWPIGTMNLMLTWQWLLWPTRRCRRRSSTMSTGMESGCGKKLPTVINIVSSANCPKRFIKLFIAFFGSLPQLTLATSSFQPYVMRHTVPASSLLSLNDFN